MKTVAAEEKDKTEKMNGEEPQEEAKEQETPAGEAEQSPDGEKETSKAEKKEKKRKMFYK